MLELTHRDWMRIAFKRCVGLAWVLIGGSYWARLFSAPSIRIVCYHRIVEDRARHARDVAPYISVTRSALRRQLRFFKKHYRVISLEEALRMLERGVLERDCLVITFDDGYADNLTLGLEVFAAEKVCPTVFVTTGCIESGQPLWPDEIRAVVYGAHLREPVALDDPAILIPVDVKDRIAAVKALIARLKQLEPGERDRYIQQLAQRLGVAGGASSSLMLSWAQVRELAAGGVAIGSHTIHHPVLSRISSQAAQREIGESLRQIRRQLPQVSPVFAYPNGTAADFGQEHVEQLRAQGYIGAVTTIRGANRPGVDPYRLRRTGIYHTDTLVDVSFKLAIEGLLQ